MTIELLTQVLQDGTNTYLYGQGRIAQKTAGSAAFSWATVWAACASSPIPQEP